MPNCQRSCLAPFARLSQLPSEKPSVTVTGIPEVTSALHRLGQQVEKDDEPAAKSATLVAGAAGSYAPVLTGMLASSYAADERYIINPMPYARFVEYGSYNVSPSFPIHRAVEANMPQIVQIYSDFVGDKIDEVGL